MNRQYSIVKLAFLIVFALSFSAYHSGSPGGRTGSSTDVNTCGVSGCHGTQTPLVADLISSSIPPNGYEGDSTYTITISANQTGIDKYGFELVAEDGDGNIVGTFIGNSEVTAFSGNRRATHKSTSNSGTDGKAWTVDWKAPAAGTGPVTFYCAALFANGNGNNSGDSVRTDQLEVQENGLVGINEISKLDLKIYPNPTTDYININGGNDLFKSIKLIDAQGKIVLNQEFAEVLSLKSLAPGSYFLKLESEEFSKTYKINKQ